LDDGRAIVVPGARNWLMAAGGRFLPREWLTRATAGLLRPKDMASRPPIEVRNEGEVPAPIGRVWQLLTDVERWPSWYRACRWVRIESPATDTQPLTFRWKAHPVELRSTVVAVERPHGFTLLADATALHAERRFSLRPTPDGRATIVVSDETQVGLLPRIGQSFIAPRLRAANHAMFDDLARAAAAARHNQ
jgi:hypothetical protein